MGGSKLERRMRRQGNLQGPSIKREAFRILQSIHRTIMQNCGESPRRCWEYMVEMLAHSTGWMTETCEAKHLWDKMANENRWLEFFECWMDEVEEAKAQRAPFSEPIGELLEEIEATNRNLDQYFTPMEVVRAMNEIALPGGIPLGDNGLPTLRGIEPCCGTGRILIDALVHNDGLFMHAIDLDLWLLRVAMLNVRMLAKWTSSRMTNSQALNPFSEGRAGETIIIGGRSIFMHGDALMVDTDFRPNWLCAGWAWKPHPWQDNLKIRGFLGSLNEWEAAGRPALEEIRGKPGDVQFDYSMRLKGKEPTWEKQLLKETG